MSEQYLVSARKYRPMTFDTVVGQSHITTTLKNAIRHNQLAHAFLFCGPRGVGKTTCARILAKTINCQQPTADMEACGVCPSCVGFQNNTLFNIFELDAASNNSVEDIRELTSQVRFAPQQGKYKVYIIDEVHMLSAAAFNAFLKTLEEPPPYAIFILATTEKHKILPTILSRCQIFDFKRITTRDISMHLASIVQKEGVTAEDAALHVIAQKSEGCMRDALSMLDRISGFTDGKLTYGNTMEHLNLLDSDFYFQITDYLLSQDVAGTMLLFDKALEKGFEGDATLDGLAEHFRNLLLCKDSRMVRLLDVPNDHKSLFNEKANQVPPSFLISALGMINDCEIGYKSANNKRLHVEICLIRLCYLLDATRSLPSEAEKKKEDDRIAPPAEFQSRPQPAASEPPPPRLTPPPVVNSTPPPAPQNIPAKPMPAPAAAAPASVPVPAPQQATEPKSQAAPKKFSKSVLLNLDEAVKQASQQTNTGQRILTQEDVDGVFEAFKKNMQQTGQSINFAQFSIMRTELVPPDEVRIISPSEFTENYAKAERNLLIDFFKSTQDINIRITTVVIPNDDAAANEPQKPMTRNEIFEDMANQNPNLARLKEALNLQIEY
jgi:DNA polymerase III subunit gamma/tau